MKTLCISLLALFFTCAVYAQQGKAVKPALKIENLYDWPQIAGQSDISNDGRYVFYTVENEPKGKSTLHITNVAKTWERHLIGVSQPTFSLNSKFISGFDTGGQFFTISLGTDAIERISDIAEFKYLGLDKEELLIYLLKDKKELHVRTLNSGGEKVYANSESYKFSPDQSKIILISKPTEESSSTQNLILLDLKTKRTQLIWKEEGTVDNYTFTFNQNGDKLAFLTTKELEDKTQQKTLWIYNLKDNKLLEVMNSHNLTDWKDFSISAIKGLTDNGNYIFVELKRPTPEIKKGIDIYSYTDTIPMSTQIINVNGAVWGNPELSFVIKVDVNKRKLSRLTYDNESFEELNDDYCLITLIESGREYRWVEYLTSLMTGERKQLPYDHANSRIFLSFDEKKILLKSKGVIGKGGDNIFSYDLVTGVTHNLTGDLPSPSVENMRFCMPSRFKLSAFLEGSNDILVSDSFDIWRIDVNGKKKAVNITNGFGGKNSIGFELSAVNFTGEGMMISLTQLDNVILKSSNYKNKDNDFYSVSLLRNVNDPKRLTHGGWGYETTGLKNSFFLGTISLKKSNDTYFFAKSNVNHAPNYFVTKDFRDITPISNVAPEKAFNWVTNELISYKDLKGKGCQGILYKPENFNPNKKYPVLFYYYATMSETLNQYLIPELQVAVPNIPFYVSNEYLVFLPDISSGKFEYEWSAKYEDALNSVEGAAQYLSELSYVNSSKIAISGHSHGGGETNYIVTHSKRYAAAFTGAGLADMIGRYGLPTHGGVPSFTMGYLQPDFFKERQMFIENSPKLYADKVTTPLLLMHNKEDDAVLFSEGLSFFNTLWKLGKRAWLLQYDGEDHVVHKNEANKLDFTIRMKQFFDHYLKDEPAPIWMTRGIRASKKGIDNGYELDNEIKTPHKY